MDVFQGDTEPSERRVWVLLALFLTLVLCSLAHEGCCPALLLPSNTLLFVLQKSRRWKSKREGTDANNRPIKAAGKVIIQDISCLLPVHKLLGELYM